MIEGFLLINKPAGITSAGCISYIKKIIGVKWGVGHAGTLDPFAQGLLIVGIGRKATRLLPHMMLHDKRYCAQATLGILTDTLDITGTMIAQSDTPIDEAQLNDAARSIGSTYNQVPPIYSALKYQGERLYRLARKQMLDDSALQNIVVQKTRLVHIYELSITEFKAPLFNMVARVSHGTYIRSLINDIAKRVGTYARTDQLTRLSIGSWSLEQAVDLYRLQSKDDVRNYLLAVEKIKS